MVKLTRVAECLYRSHEGMYFALVKVQGKQIKRSLDTKDGALAKRRLRDFKNSASRLVTEQKQSTFDLIAQRWLAQIKPDLKPSSHLRRETAINGLMPFFTGKPIRQISKADVEQWKIARGGALSDRSYNIELETLKLILDYARDELKLLLDHPASSLKRKKASKQRATIPTKQQFRRLLEEMREGASQSKADTAADLVEFLGYSGCRLSEATKMVWGEVDFEKDVFLVTGGDQGTKNHHHREIPLFAPLRRLLIARKGEGTVGDSQRIFDIDSAKKAIGSACRRAGLPHFTHHHFRHFFCSNAIEAGANFMVIADWVGHSDGGVLVAKTYGHLRAEHSQAMAKKITFDAVTI